MKPEAVISFENCAVAVMTFFLSEGISQVEKIRKRQGRVGVR
jgi:hypothetical protein